MTFIILYWEIKQKFRKNSNVSQLDYRHDFLSTISATSKLITFKTFVLLELNNKKVINFLFNASGINLYHSFALRVNL